MDELWTDLGGGIACRRHMGAYAAAELEARPQARRIETPITVWERMSKAEIDGLTAYLADTGIDFTGCETCYSARLRALAAASPVTCATCGVPITEVTEGHATYWDDADGDSLSYVPSLHDHKPAPALDGA